MKTPAPDSDPDERPWTEVAAAARDALARSTSGDGESAPFGFSTRVVSLWMARRREQAALLWQRWSFRAAAFSAVLAALAVLAGRPSESLDPAGQTLLPFPGLEVPLPTDNSHAP